MSLNTQAGAYSYMTYLLAKYTVNGTLIGYELLNDELQSVRCLNSTSIPIDLFFGWLSMQCFS